MTDDDVRFAEWARGRGQLEIVRRGWPQAGPWEQCTWAECPGRAEHPDHAYAVIRAPAGVVHIHVFCDVEKYTQKILHIQTVEKP